EEGHGGARRAQVVGEVEVVGVRDVEVDRLLDEAEAEYVDVEVDVLLHVAGDAGDVVDTRRAFGHDRAHVRSPPRSPGRSLAACREGVGTWSALGRAAKLLRRPAPRSRWPMAPRSPRGGARPGRWRARSRPGRASPARGSRARSPARRWRPWR